MKQLIIIFAILVTTIACTNAKQDNNKDENINMKQELDTAIFGSGCFWCTEAIFEEIEGVKKVEAGYIGGDTKNPTYEEVCAGNTGHAEATRIYYDSEKIDYKELLEVFWQTHDPTTLNKQGNDVGTQYRSAIFYLDDNQKELAEEYKKRLDGAKIYDKPIVTEITPATEFYVAENYHQDYYSNNPSQPYCNFVITPKVDKFRKIFKEKLKK